MKNTLRFSMPVTVLLTAFIISFRCTTAPTQVGGSVTEGGNVKTATVMGLTLDKDELPIANIPVELHDAGFIKDPADAPVKFHIDTSDAQGHFRFDSVETGAYLAEAVGSDGTYGVAKCRVFPGDTIVALPSNQLRPVGSIKGVVRSSSATRGYVQVFGLNRISDIDSADGTFELHDMPEGNFDVRIAFADQSYAAVTASAVPVISGQTTTIDTVNPVLFESEDYSLWPLSKSVILNTSSSGANLDKSVGRFPLLIRLDAPAFDFASAAHDGSDIRFALQNGGRLRYEIERWDPVLGRAEIWVLIDTVFANSTTQTLRMFWGRRNVQNWSSGESVFGSLPGCEGVWHLADRNSFIYNRTPDASGKGNNGTVYGAQAGLDGAIGVGGIFDGIDDYIVCGNRPNLAISGTITISAWVRLFDTRSQQYYRIVSKKNRWTDPDGYDMECNPSHKNGFLSVFTSDTGKIGRGYIPFDTAWYHCAVVVTDTIATIYRDGINITDWEKVGRLRAGNAPLLLGKGGGGDWLKGMIDEVRIASVERSPEWIRLSYENQRPDQRLVRFADK